MYIKYYQKIKESKNQRIKESKTTFAFYLEFGVWSLEFGVWSLEFGVWSLEFGSTF